MNTRHGLYYILLILCIVLPGCQVYAETEIYDSAVFDATEFVRLNKFTEAVTAAEEIIAAEPSNPVGYFLIGAIYQIISERFRNDNFRETVDENLDMAIELCKKKKKIEPDNPDYYFIEGAAYGYRGLHRALHGSWWGAFRDGLHCKSNLEKTLELDSTYYDAYLGLGCYYYFKTVKAKDFLWLPFISDNREKGMTLIKKAINYGYLSPNTASQSFLMIYLIEKRYDDLAALADSLCIIVPDDSYTLLYYVKALLALDSLDKAEEKLHCLKSARGNSVFCDPAGMFEEEFLRAEIANRNRDSKLAAEIIDKIISQKKLCKTNFYFAETYDNAKKLLKSIK